jgi:hypothetical protein
VSIDDGIEEFTGEYCARFMLHGFIKRVCRYRVLGRG